MPSKVTETTPELDTNRVVGMDAELHKNTPSIVTSSEASVLMEVVLKAKSHSAQHTKNVITVDEITDESFEHAFYFR